MNRRWMGLLPLVALALSSPAFALVTATIDRAEIAPGETVQLTLERNSRGGGDPDLGPLQKDFDVMGTSTGRSVEFVNGEISARVQVTVTLSPKHAGIITIPSVRWNGEQSTPVQLRVTDNAGPGTDPNTAARSAQHVFLTATLDEPKPYVLAPAILTVQLHTDIAVYQASLDLPTTDDVTVQALGKDRQFTETRDGRRFQVVERRFLLFPQKSGTLKLEGPVLDAQVAQADEDLYGGDPIFGRAFGQMLQRSRPLRLHGDPIELQVQPRPADWTASDWLPARKVTLEETWQPADAKVRAGEPITRHLTLKVDGQASAQLPDLGSQMPLPDGVRAYPDQPKLDSTPEGDTVVATREQDIALIAAKPGRITLPPVKLAWWDVTAHQARVAELPARTFEILPGAGGTEAAAVDTGPVVSMTPSAPGTTPTASSVASAASDPWRWISLALGVLWIATLGGWIATRRRVPKAVAATPAATSLDEPSLRASLDGLRKAAKRHDAAVARRHVLAWGRAAWPQDPPQGLREIGRRLGDATVAQQLDALDRACYSGADWNGEGLADGFPAKPPVAAKSARGAGTLAPLYP